MDLHIDCVEPGTSLDLYAVEGAPWCALLRIGDEEGYVKVALSIELARMLCDGLRAAIEVLEKPC